MLAPVGFETSLFVGGQFVTTRFMLLWEGFQAGTESREFIQRAFQPLAFASRHFGLLSFVVQAELGVTFQRHLTAPCYNRFPDFYTFGTSTS